MKNTRIKKVDAADAIRDIVNSAISKKSSDDARGFIGSIFGEVVKKTGLDKKDMFSEPYREMIARSVKKLAGVADDLDYYVSRDKEIKRCNGLFVSPDWGTIEPREDHVAVVRKSARAALDSVRTKENRIEITVRVGVEQRFGTDPITGLDGSLCGEYHECAFSISPEATTMQKLKATMVFIERLEKLCRRKVYLAKAYVDLSGSFRIIVEFRVGDPNAKCSKSKKVRSKNK
jgi:hypothetical protein